MDLIETEDKSLPLVPWDMVRDVDGIESITGRVYELAVTLK